MPEVQLTTIEPRYFEALAQLQRDCYPTLAPIELMGVDHLASQHAVFPGGQFVALVDGDVVGMASGFFCRFDLDHPTHTFREFCDNLYFRTHDPDGPWYYGADISVHPDCRGMGIGRLLYQARQDLVRDHGKRGIVAGGLIPGYADHKHALTPAEYVDRVVAGTLTDPTLTFQLRNGFRVRGLIPDYLEDEASDHWATLITWEA
ncbi:MAG: GNAT family N-acetyltransferase [Planctomycetota bacterium]